MDIIGSAEFSECGKYRYSLHRQWDARKAWCNFIGLNPSTADAVSDDPTIRRCIRFAMDWGYGGLAMTNLFAFRATQPAVMMRESDPVGPNNDAVLIEQANKAGIVIGAWGAHGDFLERGDNVLEMLLSGPPYKMHYLRLTKSGQPSHPLYLPASTKPSRYGI